MSDSATLDIIAPVVNAVVKEVIKKKRAKNPVHGTIPEGVTEKPKATAPKSRKAAGVSTTTKAKAAAKPRKPAEKKNNGAPRGTNGSGQRPSVKARAPTAKPRAKAQVASNTGSIERIRSNVYADANRKLRAEIARVKEASREMSKEKTQLKNDKHKAEVLQRALEREAKASDKIAKLEHAKRVKTQEALEAKRKKNQKRVDAVKKNQGMVKWFDAARACGFMIKGEDYKPMPAEGTPEHGQIKQKWQEMYRQWMLDHPEDAKEKFRKLCEDGLQKCEKLRAFLEMFKGTGKPIINDAVEFASQDNLLADLVERAIAVGN